MSPFSRPSAPAQSSSNEIPPVLHFTRSDASWLTNTRYAISRPEQLIHRITTSQMTHPDRNNTILALTLSAIAGLLVGIVLEPSAALFFAAAFSVPTLIAISITALFAACALGIPSAQRIPSPSDIRRRQTLAHALLPITLTSASMPIIVIAAFVTAQILYQHQMAPLVEGLNWKVRNAHWVGYHFRISTGCWLLHAVLSLLAIIPGARLILLARRTLKSPAG